MLIAPFMWPSAYSDATRESTTTAPAPSSLDTSSAETSLVPGRLGGTSAARTATGTTMAVSMAATSSVRRCILYSPDREPARSLPPRGEHRVNGSGLISDFRNLAGLWDTEAVPSHRGGAGLLGNPPDCIAEKMLRAAVSRRGPVPSPQPERHMASAALGGPPHRLRDDPWRVRTPHGQHGVCNELAPTAVRGRSNVGATDGQCAAVTASSQAAH